MGMRLSSEELNILNNRGEAALAEHLKTLMAASVPPAQALRAKAEGEKRDLTADEAKALDIYLDQFDVADAKLKHLERGEQFSNAVVTPAPRQTNSDPVNGTGWASAAPPGSPHQQPPRGSIITARYRDMFPRAHVGGTAGNGGFQTLADFAVAVAHRDPRLFNAAGQNEGIGVDGGFFVPTQLLAGLMDAALQEEAIRPRALIIPMSSNTIDLPMFDTKNRAGGKVAGLQGKSTAEGATATIQKTISKYVTLNARKYTVLVPATLELLADAPAVFASMLSEAMTGALRETLDLLFVSGTGAGEPLGIMNAPALITVTEESSQASGTFVAENAAKMWARLSPGAYSKAVWLAHPSVLTALYTTTLKVKNVAGSENVGGAPPQFLTFDGSGAPLMMGRPVVITDKCSPLGTKGDVILADLSRYAIGIRQDATLAVDTSVGFKESEVYYRLSMRVDGQPLLDAPITPANGTDTLSPFVTIETR